MKKFKEHLQEKVTDKFGGIYEPNGIKDIKTYENPNINITGMATYDLKNMTNLITAKLLELTKEAKMLEKNDIVLFAAFGGGFTWGSMLIKWS